MYNKIATFYLCVCSLASDFRRTFYLIIKELTLLKRLNTMKYLSLLSVYFTIIKQLFCKSFDYIYII